MAAVYEHGKLDVRGATHVHEGVHGGAHRATRIEDIVYENNALAFYVYALTVARVYGAARHAPVVAVGCHVERVDRHVGTLELADKSSDALGQRDATGLHPYEQEVFRTAVALQYFVRDTRQSAPHTFV